MAYFINITDFLGGEFNIPQENENYEILQNIIDNTEVTFLQKLLGNELYNELINDLDINNIPQSAHWYDFVNGTILKVNSYDYNYNGIFRMLKYFTRYNFGKQNLNVLTEKGIVTGLSEQSYKYTYMEQLIQLNEYYNNGCSLYNNCILMIERYNQITPNIFYPFLPTHLQFKNL